jgi:hypothetical protein
MHTHQAACYLAQGRAAKRSRTGDAAAAGAAAAHRGTKEPESDPEGDSGSDMEDEDAVDFEPEIVEDERQDVKVPWISCCQGSPCLHDCSWHTICRRGPAGRLLNSGASCSRRSALWSSHAAMLPLFLMTAPSEAVQALDPDALGGPQQLVQFLLAPAGLQPFLDGVWQQRPLLVGRPFRAPSYCLISHHEDHCTDHSHEAACDQRHAAMASCLGESDLCSAGACCTCNIYVQIR